MNGLGGSIINVSSIPSKTPAPNSSVYSGTKGAVDVISRALALELAPRKIRVNSLSPGATETEGVRAMPEYKTVLKSWQSPAPRWGVWARERTLPRPLFSWPRGKRQFPAVKTYRAASLSLPTAS